METAIKTEQRAVTTYVDEFTLVLTLSLNEAQVLYKLLWNDPLLTTDNQQRADLATAFHRLLLDINRVPVPMGVTRIV